MNDGVVVDANLALKWVLIEEDSTKSMGLLERWVDEGKEIIAPLCLPMRLLTFFIVRPSLEN